MPERELTKSFTPVDGWHILVVKVKEKDIAQHDVIGFGVYCFVDEEGVEHSDMVMPYVFEREDNEIVPFQHSNAGSVANCEDGDWVLCRKGDPPPEWIQELIEQWRER